MRKKFLPSNYAENNPENRAALGKFDNKTALELTAAKFLALKKSGFQCFKDCSILSALHKKEMRFYLHPFFKFLKNEQQVEEVFLAEK